MARGTESKAIITKKILEVFSEAFVAAGGKEIRIPIMEGGEEIQIKVTLTAAKDNISRDGEAPAKIEVVAPTSAPAEVKANEPTAEELENVKKMLDALGL